MRLRPLLAAALAAAAVLLTSCGGSHYAFKQDKRIDIVAPADRAKVRLPIDIRWRTNGLPVSPAAGPFFAVFVDREPTRPGQSLAVLADDDCRRRPGCPDVAYLEGRHVLVTDRTQVRLDTVPRRTAGGSTDRAHQATVVLIDREGRRVGEGFWTVEFRVVG
jgi:hypothetical protein